MTDLVIVACVALAVAAFVFAFIALYRDKGTKDKIESAVEKVGDVATAAAGGPTAATGLADKTEAQAALAGGLTDYIKALPEVRHVVLAYRRPGTQIGGDIEERAELIEMPAGKLNQIRAVRRTVQERKPDIIHAHSSYAGGYVRAATPRE